MSTDEKVILIHGLCGSRLDMWPISKRLQRSGYQVRNWSYWSLGHRIQTHAERLAEDLATLDRDSACRFHLVTHSMGGIIARTAFAKRQFDNLGRVVMLAPPHRGSHIARKLTPYLGWLSPSLVQLSDVSNSYVNGLPNSLEENRIEFGIVEASRDRVIAPGNVCLAGYRDFASVEGQHGILTWYPQTARLVETFLANGRFTVAQTQRDERNHQTVNAV